MVETATLLGWTLVTFAALIVRQHTRVTSRVRAAPRKMREKAPVNRKHAAGAGGLVGGVVIGPTVWSGAAGLVTSAVGGSLKLSLAAALAVMLVVAGGLRLKRLGAGEDDD